MVADTDFNGAENLLAHFADRRTQHGNGFRGVPVKDGQKVLMDEALIGVQPASGQQCVFKADGGRLAKGSAYVNLIIPIQITAVNDGADLPPMVDAV